MYVNIIMVAQLEHRSHLAASTTAAALQNAASAPLKCPRCDSANTKFCYYNNYSLAQPRHFCKSCKRYWTRGGTLRNVPVGGGSRKNKRSKKARPSAASSRSPPLPATTNLSPFLYGLPPPKSDLHPLHGYEESFQLSHLQQPTASLLGDYSLLISDHQLPSATYQPLLSYDHGLPLGSENPTHSLDPSYLYWNHGVGSGWPESGPSAAPLH